MKKIWLLIVFLTSYLISTAHGSIKCEISTSFGIIIIELLQDKAPKTVANFLKYVDNHWYDSSYFFRVCTPENELHRKFPIEVIQGGDLPENKRFSPIDIETTKQNRSISFGWNPFHGPRYSQFDPKQFFHLHQPLP